MPSQLKLSGSHCEHPTGSIFAGQPAPNQIIQITCVLRRAQDATGTPTGELSHEKFEQAHGARAGDIEAVERFAANHDFSIVHVNRAARTVILCGPLSALAEAFGAQLELRQIGAHTYRTRQGDLHLHPLLENKIVAVLGFDQRPIAKTHHQVSHRGHTTSYFPAQVAQAYNFPAANGSNETIALIELGGGFTNSDLEAYWNLAGVGSVNVSAIGVNGGSNQPVGDPGSADGEVALDIEVAGAVAPGAKIAVYFAPNTAMGFLEAINSAIHDKARKPSVISISWGGPENQWTPQAMNAFNAAFHDAALLGVSVCAASGDGGSSDGATDGADHADFPASSPWVLACGGTNLVVSGAKIQAETVWNNPNGGASGGGVSSHFSKPAYQAAVNVPKPLGTVNKDGRGLPDVAGDADPATGYKVIVDGSEIVVGGTSAVAPLWAGLIALLNQQLGRNVGWLHPKLYGVLAHSQALHDITSGSNGTYSAHSGWDPCTGLGSPNGQAILTILKQQ